jgi:hypothetical protein
LATGLWRINLRKEHQQHPHEVTHNVYELRNTGALVNYLHKAMFSPTKSAFLQEVRNDHLTTWPDLTEQAINKHLKLTPVTAMGHMNQRRQNIRSTSKNTITPDMEDAAVTSTGLGTNNHLVYAVVVYQGQLYTYLTVKFPVRSSKGDCYVMVCYVFDWNYVKVVPMKSRSASEWVKAYDLIHQERTSKGFKPKLQTLDNEASSALHTFSQPMTWSINLSLPIVIGVMLPKGQFALSRNILLQDCHQLTQISHDVGHIITTSRIDLKSTLDIQTTSTIIRYGSLS